jgi:hypothetical protein
VLAGRWLFVSTNGVMLLFLAQALCWQVVCFSFLVAAVALLLFLFSGAAVFLSA